MDFKRKKRRFRFGLLLRLFILVALIAAAAAFWITRPQRLEPDALAGLSGDPGRGERVFWAGGCASCHAAEDATGDERLVLSGGRRFESDFGTFVAPNISSDPTYGIGGWTTQDLANAVMKGVSPDGRHYYPAFPYTSYAGMELQDVTDLHAFMATLPPSDRPSEAHEVEFPFSLRWGIGAWKLFYANEHEWVVTGDLSPLESRGRYLSEVLAHCGQCHTPRDALGGLQTGRWFAGAPNPSGQGRIPNISPALLRWTPEDVVAYLTYGLTPDFDSAGGPMAEVVQNLSQLPDEDREAIAAYLQRVRPVQ